MTSMKSLPCGFADECIGVMGGGSGDGLILRDENTGRKGRR